MAGGRSRVSEMWEQSAAAVTLCSGDRVLLRPVDAGDAEMLAAGFAELSAESRFHRFFTAMPELTQERLTYLTEIDHHDHEAIGALCADTGEGLGIARYVRSPDVPDQAEVAVAVVDAWQGRGLGTALLTRLAERAAAEGVCRLTGEVQAGNERVLRLVRRLGATVRRDGALLTVRLDLPPRDVGA